MSKYSCLDKDTCVDPDDTQFTALFGEWRPDVQNSDNSPENIENVLNRSLTELEKAWVDDFSNQIHDFENILDKESNVITKNYINRKVTLVYNKKETFIIEMLRKCELTDGEDYSDIDAETLENNVYSKGNDIPIYTENVNDNSSKILGNFWISFMDHGLPQYISNVD